MHNTLFKKISIYRFHIIIAILVVLLIITLLHFLLSDVNSKSGIIAGGISASLIVAIIQFLFSLNEYKSYSDIKKLGIKRILVSRDDHKFYSNFISKAKKDIKVMGVTALRMIQDFADESSPREDKKVLLTALSRSVTVKILLPELSYLHNQKDAEKSLQSKPILEKINKKYDNFEVHYFSHVPTHSIFLVDQECILGPVFSNYESKDTPCIYMSINNDFASKYLDYFDNEWKESK